MDEKYLQVQKKDLGLYLHIPFCVKKCDYCDFLSAPADENTKKAYVKALISEIRSYKELASKYLVKTIFIGGGTPSAMDGQYISDIMDALKSVFTIHGINDANNSSMHMAEITIEINPGTITKEKLMHYKAAGMNRLSFGLQSTDNEELRILGRIHTYEEFEENFHMARELGFHNINIDLMSALPGQTLEKWQDTLEKVVSLDPEHISAYSLMIEEGTPFFTKYKEEDQNEDLDRDIYMKTKEYLEHTGYYRYEISNYSKPGLECKHNSSYWTGVDYQGIGLGASSLLHNSRFHNDENLNEYIKLSSDCNNIRRAVEILTVKQQMEEFMFLGLRMSVGVNKDTFKNQFGVEIEKIYGGVLNHFLKDGMLMTKGNHIYLSDKGLDISNLVMSEFILEDSDIQE